MSEPLEQQPPSRPDSASPHRPEPPEEVAKHDPNSLYPYCKVCPSHIHCCYRATTIVVLPTEADSIIARTGRPDLLQREESGLTTIKKEKGHPCPFLTSERLCGIYDIRPIDCRSWPLTMDHSADPNGRYLVDADCPAAEDSHLESKFVAAARATLSQVPAHLRRAFVKLVYRDYNTLPMKPYTNSNQPPKDPNEQRKPTSS